MTTIGTSTGFVPEISFGIGNVDAIKKLELYPSPYPEVPRVPKPPAQPPRSAAARRKWAFVLARAQEVGLEKAYSEWKFKELVRPRRRAKFLTAKAIADMFKEALKGPSWAERIAPPILVSEEIATNVTVTGDQVLAEIELVLPVPLTYVTTTIGVSGTVEASTTFNNKSEG